MRACDTRSEDARVIPIDESTIAVLAALTVVGVTLLILMRQQWFHKLTTPSQRRHHTRRRRRPRFRRAA